MVHNIVSFYKSFMETIDENIIMKSVKNRINIFALISWKILYEFGNLPFH